MSPAPVFSPFLERLYGRLPEAYRYLDERVGDYPLKRFLALVGDQAGAVEALLDRIDYVAPYEGGAPGATSDLVDPRTAEPGWLEWLAQIPGVPLPPELTEAERRDAIEFASSGWRVGTKDAIGDAARTALIGTKYARVVDHTTDVSPVGAATEWDMAIVTLASETPDPAAVLAAVLAKEAKPAGVKLYHRGFESSWEQVEAELPTWADWEAAGSWGAVEESGFA